MSNSTSSSFFSEVRSGVTAKFLMAIIGFVGTIIFARVFSPSELGGYYLLLSLVHVYNTSANGIGSACKKRVSESVVPDDEVVGLSILALSTLSIISIAVSVIVGEWLTSYTGINNAPLLFATLVSSLGSYIFLEKVVAGKGRFGLAEWGDTFRSLLTIPFQIGLVAAGLEIFGMVAGLVVASVIATVFLFLFSGASITFPSRNTISSVWEYSRFSLPSTITGRVYDRLDILLLGVMVSQAASGNYEVALKLTLPATLISSVLSNGVLPRVSSQIDSGEDPSKGITNTLAFAGILAVPIFFGAVVLAPEIIATFYGSEYSGAAPYLIGLALYSIFRAYLAPLQSVTLGFDNPQYAFLVNGSVLIVNVALGVSLISLLGGIGVVIATVFSEALRCLLFVYYLNRVTNSVSFVPREMQFQWISGFVMSSVVLATNQFIEVQSWFHLLVLVGIGATAYFATLYTLSPGHRNIVSKSISMS